MEDNSRTSFFFDGWNTTKTGFFFDGWAICFFLLSQKCTSATWSLNINQSHQNHLIWPKTTTTLLVLVGILILWRKLRDQVACIRVCRVQRCKKNTINIYLFFKFVSQGSFFSVYFLKDLSLILKGDIFSPNLSSLSIWMDLFRSDSKLRFSKR